MKTINLLLPTKSGERKVAATLNVMGLPKEMTAEDVVMILNKKLLEIEFSYSEVIEETGRNDS